MPVVSMRTLLETGVHFGHRARRWNPKMKPYIFTERNGIHIIDLQQTVPQLDAAYALVRDTVAKGGSVLFVGTKRQAQETIAAEAEQATITGTFAAPRNSGTPGSATQLTSKAATPSLRAISWPKRTILGRAFRSPSESHSPSG